MADPLNEELEALCVAYLTQNLKEFPSGMAIDYFERTFPEKMDETHDWYHRTFKKPSVLAALQSIPNSVRISYRGSSAFVSLNKNSDKVDRHLVDLVSNQRASGKSKGRRPMSGRSHSQRVLDSFTLNRRPTNSYSENRFQATFNSGRSSKSLINNSRSTAIQEQWNRSTVYRDRPSRSSTGDPRLTPHDPRSASSLSDQKSNGSPWTYTSSDPRSAYSTSSPAPVAQVRPMTTTALSSATPSKQPPTSSYARTPPSSSSSRVSHVPTPVPKSTPYKTLGEQVKSAHHIDAELERRKLTLRNNLVELLTSKFDTLKVFYLANIYKEEYKEDLEPSMYGHKTMTNLLNDPFFKDYIRIIPDFPYNLIRAVNKGEIQNGKENLTYKKSNANATTEAQVSSTGPFVDRSNNISASKANYNAIDPFNVRTMLQSLEPLKDIKSAPLGNHKVDDVIKYRTMRIIFKSEDMMLKLDDWEMKYAVEWNSRMRVPVQDYGFRTLLEFFKHLALDIPIKIRLMNDEWVAKSDYTSVSKWLNESLEAGKYRAYMVLSKQYDSVAFPNETYPAFGLKGLPRQDYYPVTIMSVKSPHKMWLQLKTQETITAHLSIETSLTSYADYKKKNSFPVPIQFVKVGFPCVAYDEQQQRWCRAAIAEVPQKVDEDSILTAFLVDYGVARHVKRAQLQCILRTHLAIPVGLIYAQLEGVLPEYEKMARMTLQEFTNPPVVLACKIPSTTDSPEDDVDVRWQSRKSIYNVTLVDTRQGRDCDLATAINNCTSPSEDNE